MTIFLKILFLLLAYLIGSIPFGLVFAKSKKIDLRKEGSGNIGAANAGRILGKKYGYLTFALDMVKGSIFVILFRYQIIPSTYLVLSPALYGFVAIIGHTFSIFLKFEGGKAVATGAGFIFSYLPIAIPIGLIAFLIVFLKTRIASLGSLVSTIFVTILAIVFTIIGKDVLTGIDIDIYFAVFAFFTAVLIFIKHIPNIKRLINKNENIIAK